MHRSQPSCAWRGPIALLYFNAGGGHRAAAYALKTELEHQYPDWPVVLVDLFAVLDPQRRFKRLTGFAPEAYYNKRLSTGFTLGLKQELKILQAMIRFAHPRLVRKLVRYWQVMKPCLVVSLVPNFNRAIGASLESYRLDLPETLIPELVTVMTDLADYPPHFWVEPAYTGHLICGTQRAYAQALAQGLPAHRVHCVSGMVLSSRFYRSPTDDVQVGDRLSRARAREALGFTPEQAVGCVMFGGHGSAVMRQIALLLVDRPLILLCGRNDALKRRLQRLTTNAPHVVVGFTDDVAYWMQLADYFIGKPGPGSISEALHCGLPVIVTRNAWTMPQERFNTDWVADHHLGQVVTGVAQMSQAVTNVTANLAQYRAAVGQLDNRALFEVVDLLAWLCAPRGFHGTQREPLITTNKTEESLGKPSFV